MTFSRDNLVDAVRYWEERRLIYNAVLAVITVGGFVLLIPRSVQVFEARTIYGTFILALGANAAYCAAYIPDIVAQATSFRDQWRRWRWVFFLIGMVLAVVIAVPTVVVCYAAPFSH
jgi:membrane-associated phospholipid phosphatase